jgi:uncharacterized coiled-coil protein SlyX
MPDLTLTDVHQQIGALVMQLWQQGKAISELQQQIVALTLKIDKPREPGETP